MSTMDNEIVTYFSSQEEALKIADANAGSDEMGWRYAVSPRRARGQWVVEVYDEANVFVGCL